MATDHSRWDGCSVLAVRTSKRIFLFSMKTENDISSQKSEKSNRFQGIAFNLKSDEEMKELNQRFVNFCSYLDKRRW
jgi:hypothetical protein